MNLERYSFACTLFLVSSGAFAYSVHIYTRACTQFFKHWQVRLLVALTYHNEDQDILNNATYLQNFHIKIMLFCIVIAFVFT